MIAAVVEGARRCDAAVTAAEGEHSVLGLVTEDVHTRSTPSAGTTRFTVG